MKRALSAWLVTIGLLATRVASADPPPVRPEASDLDGIDRTARDAYTSDDLSFCKKPAQPLGMRQRALCSLASEVEGCEGLVKACGLDETPDVGWLAKFLQFAAPVARVLLYVFVAAVVLALVVPIVMSLRRRRKQERAVAEGATSAAPEVLGVKDELIVPEDVSDAELALRQAEEHRQRGELKKALGLYLAASLSALDQRGAIRVARHRTNGEYVRSCREDLSRPPLREIVREVDRVTFGGVSPSEQSLHRVSSCASEIVRKAAAPVALMLALFAIGCTPPRKGSDPAGNELPTAVLERNGYEVRPLETSLATMPIPEDGSGLPVVFVDLEKVPLEEETRTHLLRWVEAGGTLVLFGIGERNKWQEPKADPAEATTHDLVVRVMDPDEDRVDEESDEGAMVGHEPLTVTGARLARSDAFSWHDEAESAETVASLDKAIYASKRRVGKGMLLGIANDDLFTNIGMMPRRNASALVTIVRTATHDPYRELGPVQAIRVARAEDGISPPSNPFSALFAAGLGKGIWHALAAAAVLFLAYGIRLTRPRAEARVERRTFAEHVAAVGSFYRRARAYPHAFGSYGRFVELRLRESLPRGTDPIAFLAAQSGTTPERVTELLARAEKTQANDAPVGDELAAIEELRGMMEKALVTRSR